MSEVESTTLITLLVSPETLTPEEVARAKQLAATNSSEFRELHSLIDTLSCAIAPGAVLADPPMAVTARVQAVVQSWEAQNMTANQPSSPQVQTPERGQRPRRRKLLVAGGIAAGIVVFALGLWQWSKSGKNEVVVHDGGPQPVSGNFPLPRDRADREAALFPDKDDIVISQPVLHYTGQYSDSTKYAPSQLAIEKLICELGEGRDEQKFKFKNKKTGEEKEYTLPPNDRTLVDEDPALSGYELAEKGFEIRTYERKYHAQLCKRILFTTQDPRIYPGSLLQGNDWVLNRSIVPIAFDPAKGDRAPVKLTLLGVSHRSELPKASEVNFMNRENQAALIPTFGKNLPNSRTLAESYQIDNPDSREAYERALRDLVPRVKEVDNWAASVEVVHSKDHLDFMLKGSASFSYGPIAAAVEGSIRQEEDIEKGRVFMMLNRAAYTVAVDTALPPAAWFTPKIDPSRFGAKAPQSLNGPPVYVSSVTYGQVILIIAETQRKASDLKAALKTSFSYAGFIKGDAEAEKKAREELSAASINVFVYGGSGRPLFGPAGNMLIQGPVSQTASGLDGIQTMLSKLLSAELQPTDALPIAFETRYVAGHRPAGFMGVLPMKTYEAKTAGYEYDVALLEADIKDVFDGFLFFDNDGEFHFRTSHGDDANPLAAGMIQLTGKKHVFDPPHWFSASGNHYAPSRRFNLKFKVGEHDHPPENWEKWGNPGRTSESSFEVVIDELMAAENYQKDYSLSGFKGGNSFKLRVKLKPPPEKKAVKDLDLELRQ